MEEIRKIIYGLTLEEALESKLCIACKTRVLSLPNTVIADHWAIYEEYGYCPDCWSNSKRAKLDTSNVSTKRQTTREMNHALRKRT